MTLSFFNGTGGFSPDGREYVISIADDKMTPAPWANVIANPNFGTVISESGQCYTWNENAHEMRLTPWENDPVSDLGGEAFYLRDEETGISGPPLRFPVVVNRLISPGMVLGIVFLSMRKPEYIPKCGYM